VQVDRAVTRLRELIVDGAYPAGSGITEAEVAGRFAMSRTPVREALRALAAEGLVRPAGRGVVVVSLDPDELVDTYQARAALEALTAELAATRHSAGRVAPADLAALRESAAAAAEATTAGRLLEGIRHNRSFHRQIAVLAGNAVVLRMLDRIWDQIQVSTLDSLSPPTRPAHVNAEHDDMVAAIVDGRAEDAGRVARRHVLGTLAATSQGG
jgi:DNA-binding GntR family transcriptional regulator